MKKIKLYKSEKIFYDWLIESLKKQPERYQKQKKQIHKQYPLLQYILDHKNKYSDKINGKV